MSKITGKVNYKEVLKGDTGYTFEPHVTVDGILYWTNNGNLENPLPVNLHGKQGFVFIPHVDSEGNLSWTNTGELENPPTVNIKGDKGYFYTPHISEDGILSWTNNGNLENPQPFNISDLILNEVKESRVDTTGKSFSKLKERLDSDFKKLSESIKNNDTKDEVVQARTATTGENFMTLDDRIDHEVMRLREKIEVTMLEQEDKESHDISNTINGMSSDMIIKGKTIKLDNGEIKSFGQEEGKIVELCHNRNLMNTDDITDRSINKFLNNDGVISGTFTRLNQGTNTGKFRILEKTKVIIKAMCKGCRIIIKNCWLDGGEFRPIIDTNNWSDNKNQLILGARTCYVDKNSEWYVENPHGEEVDFEIKEVRCYLASESNFNYIRYKEDKKEIQLSKYGFEEGLRGINNTLYDELNEVKNKAVKRIAKYTLTGNENIERRIMVEESKTIGFGIHVYSLENLKIGGECLSNNFIYSEPNHCWNVDKECVSISDFLHFRIDKSKLTTPDVEGFKAWLKANPTTIYYELAEPIETPLNKNINLKTFNDKTYVNFENSIKGASSFKVPVNTNKLINDLKFEKEDLKEKFNNLTTEFENFKTYMIQTLPYKGE